MMLRLLAPAAVAHGPKLRDIHLPPPPGWWPLAPGWWGVIGLLIALTLIAGWLLWRWQRQRRRWRAIATELDRIALHAEASDRSALAAGLSRLLRRAARRAGGDVHLEGAAWQTELERLAPDILPPTLVSELAAAHYQPRASLDVDPTLTASRRWLRQVTGQRDV